LSQSADLEPQAQKDVISVFHFALHPGAYLLLGNAETVGAADALFKPVSKKWRIYQRQATRNAEPLPLPSSGGRACAPDTTSSRPEQLRFTQMIDLAQQVLL